MPKVIAIDPGNIESAYVILEFSDPQNIKILEKGKVSNMDLLMILNELDGGIDFAIEMVASYGMAVGVSVFETVFWIGRFWECSLAGCKTKVYRKDVKMNLCNAMKAKDSNISQALKDRFGVVGTKKNQGYFYGFHDDIWSAFAVGVTYIDKFYVAF